MGMKKSDHEDQLRVNSAGTISMPAARRSPPARPAASVKGFSRGGGRRCPADPPKQRVVDRRALERVPDLQRERRSSGTVAPGDHVRAAKRPGKSPALSEVSRAAAGIHRQQMIAVLVVGNRAAKGEMRPVRRPDQARRIRRLLGGGDSRSRRSAAPVFTSRMWITAVPRLAVTSAPVIDVTQKAMRVPSGDQLSSPTATPLIRSAP